MKQIKEIFLHNATIKAISLILAFFVWRIVGDISDPVVTMPYRDVSVQMLNEEIVTDAGKVYQVADNNHAVTVMVTAPKSIQARITKEHIQATADFEEILLEELVPVEVKVAGYENNAKVSAVSTPNNIVVTIEDSISKKFPIVPSAVGELDKIYALGKMSALPETVTINGPKSLVESIVRVEGQVSIYGLKEDNVLEGKLLLYDKNNILIDQTILDIELSNELQIAVEVLDTKSVQLELNTSGVPKIGYEVASIIAEPSEIIVSGNKEILDKIDYIEVPGSAINVSGKHGKLELVVDVADYIPKDISLYDTNSSTIAVTVQIDELGTKSLDIPVQSIVVNNNPSNLALSYAGTTTVRVTFTGLDLYLTGLDPSDVTLSIDLKEYKTPGKHTIPVVVTAPSGVSQVDEIEVIVELAEMGVSDD